MSNIDINKDVHGWRVIQNDENYLKCQKLSLEKNYLSAL